MYTLLGFSLAGCMVLGYRLYEVHKEFGMFKHHTKQLITDIANGEVEVSVHDTQNGTQLKISKL